MTTILDNATIATRLHSFNTAHSTRENRRDLATALVTPNAKITEYTGMLEVRYQLSLLWALGHQTVMKAAGHLWRVPPLINEYAGQRAIVFQRGERATSQRLKYGEYLTMTVGILPPEQPAVSHRISPRRSFTASPLVTDIQSPLAYGVATIPLQEARRLSVDYGDFTISAPEPDIIQVPVYEATAHIGADAEHSAATAQVNVYHMFAGDIAVQAYLDELANAVQPDVGANLRAELGLPTTA